MAASAMPDQHQQQKLREAKLPAIGMGMKCFPKSLHLYPVAALRKCSPRLRLSRAIWAHPAKTA
jgi:hypothetical protein